MTISIKFNNKLFQVPPSKLPDIIENFKIIAAQLGVTSWNEKYTAVIGAWAKAKDKNYSGTVAELAQSVIVEALNTKGKKLVVPYTFSKEELQLGKIRRRLVMVGSMYNLFDKNISIVVPGVNKLPKDQLLPLDDHKNQLSRWQKTNAGIYLQLKPKGEKEEAQVSAFGNPNNPSMVYWKNNRQLGHRYQGVQNLHYAQNDSNNRTYGSKKKLEGKIYKISGMVDGHGIQAQNNQFNLDRSSPYKTADEHPHNMYWENQAYGKFVRQKGFEDNAFKSCRWFLHVNSFNNYVQPTKEFSSNGKEYIVADYVHNLIQNNDQSLTYIQCNNSILADYGDLNFRKKNGDYRTVDRKAWTKTLSLKIKTPHGGSAQDHIIANKRPFHQFPYAKVIDPSSPSFQEFAPDFRHGIPGYESPVSSPDFILLPQEQVQLSGLHFEGEQVSKNSFVEFLNAYDSDKIQTTVTTFSLNLLSDQDIKEINEQIEKEDSSKSISAPIQEETERKATSFPPQENLIQSKYTFWSKDTKTLFGNSVTESTTPCDISIITVLKRS